MNSHKSEEGVIIYNPISISERGNVEIKIAEEKNCAEPRIVVYNQKAKMTFWSFGVLGDKKTYVFYVPQGTVRRSLEVG